MRYLLVIVLVGACLQLDVLNTPVSAGTVLPVVAIWAAVVGYWYFSGYANNWWLCSAVCGFQSSPPSASAMEIPAQVDVEMGKAEAMSPSQYPPSYGSVPSAQVI